jgi:hypothetical protein
MRAKKLSNLLILLFAAATASAATRLVPAQYPNIQSAIDDCNDGDEVIASEGTYYENLLFRGKNITLRSTNPEDPNVVAATVIDGNGLGSVITFSGSENYLCVLSGFTITGGRNYSTGGGIDGLGTAATISHCFIAGNYGRNGGGIRHSSGTIADSIITNNHANETGGGLGLCHNSKVTNCIISNNSAKNYGGGTGYSGYITISNCLIINNTAGKGGGLASPHHAKIVNCTIVGNKSTIEGAGGVYYGDGSYIVSSIVWGNAPYQVDKYIARYYCCIQGGASGIHIINRDPRFVSPTEGDYHLLPDSPCIEHGHPDYTPLPDTDIDGYPRIIGRVVDMGIYEFVFDTPHIGVLSWSVAFNAFQDRANPEPQTLSIYNAGTDSLNWHITENCQWLQVNPTSGITTTGTDELTLTVDITGMPWGVYDCNLTISDPCASNNPLIIPISLQITGPILSVSPASFNFLASKENPTPSSQTLHIQNIGGGTLDWQLTEDCNWLRIYPLSAQTRDVNEVTLTADTTALADGFYSCSLTIDDPNAANSPQIVEVCLWVDFEQVWLYVSRENPNIQAAIDWALPGDIVVVARGTYTGPGNRDIDFRGKPITVRSTNPNDANVVAQTIIDCNGGPGDYHCGFDFHTSEDGNSILAGFTIINGYADQGAGIRIRVTTGGRGVPLTGPVECRILNCIITLNTAIYDGGGVYIFASSPTITNCTITDNKSRSGGGIFCSRSDAVVTNCKFARNSASFGGGASCSEGDVLILANCTLTSNLADIGGAVYSSGSSPSITCCTISENTALSGGGALFCYYSGKPTVNNSILYSNTAPSGPEIALRPYYGGPSLLNWAVSYSNIRGGLPAIYNLGGVAISWGPGNITAEPYFVDANSGDYHLRSGGWRWDVQRKTWTWDAVTSRCIDAGDPDAPLCDEPLFVPVDPTGYWGANLRINMGAYGGTAEASIPPHGWAVRTDYSNDGIANFADFAYWTKNHPYTAGEPLGLLNPGPALDPIDLAVLAADWLDQTTWFQMPGQASAPNPPDGSVGIRLDPVLGWQAGAGATSHNVYFGTSDPPTFQVSTTTTTFVPGYLLSKNTTYYWRIDEVNSFGKTAGPVWTFTTGTGGGGR